MSFDTLCVLFKLCKTSDGAKIQGEWVFTNTTTTNKLHNTTAYLRLQGSEDGNVYTCKIKTDDSLKYNNQQEQKLSIKIKTICEFLN